MDPFTEKLLERTRARRENLQKKLSERPAAAGAAKRLREPLGETNSLLSDQVPQTTTKPSPSKRKYSGENLPSAANEENLQPVVVQSAALQSDRPTDKKPPLCPSSGRSSSSSSLAVAAALREPEKMFTPSPSAASREVQEEKSVVSAAGMKSRLQRLAEQRRCWEGGDPLEAADDSPSVFVLERPAEVPVVVAPPTASSEAPLGRRGRLAHLAATIGSWEDHQSPRETQRAPPGPGPLQVLGSKHGTTSSSAASGSFISKQTSDTRHPSIPKKIPASLSGPQKTLVPSSSPQKTPAPSSSAKKTTASLSGSQKTPTPSSGPQKTLAPSSSPKKTLASSSSSQNTLTPSSGPQKITTPSSSPQKTLVSSSDPQKTPASSSGSQTTIVSSPAVLQSPSTVLQVQPAPPPGAVKSFLECVEERVHHSTPARGAPQNRTPAGGAVSTRMMQDRLRTVNTSTADLTQRQKLERESELALIRNRFQKGNNIFKNNNKQLQNKTTTDHEARPPESSKPADNQTEPPESSRTKQDPAEGEETPPESEDEPTKKTYSETSAGFVLSSPPVCSSTPPLSPDNGRDQEKDSITSAVISQLFEGVLDQTEEETEEEEDALNISSMSLLAPLASVVASPDRRLMTSTPAQSFLLKNHTPDCLSHPRDVQEISQVQEISLAQSSSSDCEQTREDDLRLPYSIDAYRSARLKDTERPNINQVVLRTAEIPQGAGGPGGVGLLNVKQRVKILSSELNLQQTVIHQASQALNCCTDEEHGKGSEVEAEAERLLLVATKRREALKSELDRLRENCSVAPEVAAATSLASRGSISLQELRLPLKADFVCSAANRPDSTRHSFFILLRSGAEQTVATPLASIHRGLSGDTLSFPTQFTLSDASSDFKIHVEVYCLVQKREPSTDKKKRNQRSKVATPRRFLPITKTAHPPVVASPGGPHAVRTSNFILGGSHTLSLASIGKSKFPLAKVPFSAPLEGHVFLRLQCDVGSRVEERGFLTMFEDVSGFGAWHRRWCVLSGTSICYWTYPDNERRKAPIGRINLASCTSRAVEPVSREFCARPNTLELITARPQRDDDKETLVSQCTDTMCVTRNWLSADTKDERNLWMKKLNQILTDLRMWQPDACSRP